VNDISGPGPWPLLISACRIVGQTIIHLHIKWRVPYVRKDKLKGIVNLHSWKYLRTLPPHVMFWFNFTLCPTNDLITQAEKGGVGLSPAIKFRVLVGRDFDLTWKLSPIRGPRIM